MKAIHRHNHIDETECFCNENKERNEFTGTRSQFEQALSLYNLEIDDQKMQSEADKIIKEEAHKNYTKEVLKRIYNCIDHTSLSEKDNDHSIMDFTRRVNDNEEEFPEMGNVASICVYPCFAETVKDTLETEEVGIACVCGGFPSSQTFSEIKIAETGLALADGATEIDTVMSIGKYLDGNYEEMCDDIGEIKEICKERILKVILETGTLKEAKEIKRASILCLYAGADFIKTSTGKNGIGATTKAALVMCRTIKEYFQKTGIRKGFKAAGGIRTVEEAINYFTIVKIVLGEEWLNKRLFRIGSSNLAKKILDEVENVM